ncbi:hypothetical protein NKH77_53980 [Streptomyces sp. M19]
MLHRHLGVPVELPFSLQRIDFRVADVEAYRNDHAWPSRAICATASPTASAAARTWSA